MEQLYFYALCFELIHNRLPDKLGFYFFKFAGDKEKAFDWFTPDREKIEELRAKLVDTFTKIQKTWFRATPSTDSCKYCPYESVCVERQQQKAQKREKQRWARAERGEETLPSLAESNTGSAMVGFGGKIEPID